MGQGPLFESSKRCSDCGEFKSLDGFPRNKNYKDGRHPYCKPCHNARGKETKDRLYGGSRHYHLTRRYGVTAADVDVMIEAHGGTCAICREKPAVHVDHDHATGKVRGILCFGCNGGLGQFQDDTARMLRAIEYVELHRDPGDVHEPPTPYILSVA